MYVYIWLVVDQVHGEYEKIGNLILNNNHLTLIMVDNLLDLEHTLWLVVELPIWKIWVRQLGWWYSQSMEK